jgi:hypothetical protein
MVAPLAQITVQDPELPVSLRQTVPLTVVAADDQLVARIDLYDNNLLIAQAMARMPAPVYTYEFRWTPVALGRHLLQAVAIDSGGNASPPVQIALNVIGNNRAPAVLITSPSGLKDAEVGAPLTIQGVATDDVAVTRMDLIVDNALVTFISPDEPEGVTPYAVAMPWTPLRTGPHNIVLRAYDNQGASDDSLPYVVRVFDNQPPVVSAEIEYSTLKYGDTLVVHAFALSSNGLGRIELYVDGALADVSNSSTPSLQTSLQTTLAAADHTEGTHTFFVRAYDATGLTAETPATPFFVTEDASWVPRATPRSRVTPTAQSPAGTATAPLVLPEPPTVEIRADGDSPYVILPEPARIKITAHGSTELGRIELWAKYPGEPTARLLLDESGKGATEKVVAFDANMPRAGVVEFFARVTDSFGQGRVSVPLHMMVQSPVAPTSVPAFHNLSGTWFAESPAVRYEAMFSQIGRSLRGVLVELPTNGKASTGEIVSGTVNDKSVYFGVGFTQGAGAWGHTLEFECAYTPRPAALTCNYTNEKRERGSVIFAQADRP